MKDYVNPENTRSGDQRAVYEQIVQDGVCPFCQDNFLKYHTKPIIANGEHWVLTESAWPYDGTRQHFLLVLKRHETDFAKLRPEEGAELIALTTGIVAERGVRGGALGVRFGNHPMLKNSVAHLHAQLIEPDFDAPQHPGVKLQISKKAE